MLKCEKCKYFHTVRRKDMPPMFFCLKLRKELKNGVAMEFYAKKCK